MYRYMCIYIYIYTCIDSSLSMFPPRPLANRAKFIQSVETQQYLRHNLYIYIYIHTCLYIYIYQTIER